MKLAATWLVIILPLLSLQLGGLHRHIDTLGQAQGLHHIHLHDRAEHGHDHDREIDLPILELGTLAYKAMLFLIIPVVVFILGLTAPHLALFNPNAGMRLRNTTRWRPPLRAPPAVS